MENWKVQVLPLARIKKIMKSQEVLYLEEEKERDEIETPPHRFMVKGEASVLMGKACELLIRELTMRSWRHTENHRRKTLQKQDLEAAVKEDEVYDYLIDIIPRTQPGSGAALSGHERLLPKLFSFVPSPTETSLKPGVADGSIHTEMSINDAKLRLAQLLHMQNMILHDTGLHQNHGLNSTLPVQNSGNVNPTFYAQSAWNTTPTLQNFQNTSHPDQEQNTEKRQKSS